jgi:hypothetical protein
VVEWLEAQLDSLDDLTNFFNKKLVEIKKESLFNQMKE